MKTRSAAMLALGGWFISGACAFPQASPSPVVIEAPQQIESQKSVIVLCRNVRFTLTIVGQAANTQELYFESSVGESARAANLTGTSFWGYLHKSAFAGRLSMTCEADAVVVEATGFVISEKLLAVPMTYRVAIGLDGSLMRDEGPLLRSAEYIKSKYSEIGL